MLEDKFRRIAAVAFFILVVAVGALAQRPEVFKVEPPNWWANHSINPVRVLVRGRNLAGARVEPVGSGILIGLVRVNAAGTYLFADVEVAPEARPGRRALRIIAPGGSVEVPFEISAPLDRRGRFQGFGPDDVIYLIMPDRFADGDPKNNDPPKSRGLYDRRRARYITAGIFAASSTVCRISRNSASLRSGSIRGMTTTIG